MGLRVLHNGAMVDSDLLVLDRQAREGDPVSGWRGDDTMSVAVTAPDDRGVSRIQVRARDATNTEYVAASVPIGTEGWRHKLLDKLVRGDWQRGTAVSELFDQRAKVEAERDKDWRSYITEHFAPKLHHAFVKDGLAQRQDFYMTPRGKR